MDHAPNRRWMAPLALAALVAAGDARVSPDVEHGELLHELRDGAAGQQQRIVRLGVAGGEAVYSGYPVIPTLIDPAGVATVRMCEFRANVLPPLAAGQAAPATSVWGYVPGSQACPAPTTVRDTYIGPVVVAMRNKPLAIDYVNDLGSTGTTAVNAWKFSTDQTLHWADPLNQTANACMMKIAMTGALPTGGTWPGAPDACALNYAGPIPVVPHLHGGEVPPALDGSPDSWFTSDATGTTPRGKKYYSRAGAAANEAIYTYPNQQEPAPIWFHDHTLGATRLNVYAGLAGAYYLVDPAQPQLPGLGVADVVPLVLQDRMFDSTGQLFFPADSYTGVVWTPNPDHPYWVPEFVGDSIVVNGKAWPYLDVQQKRYRFLVLNGSNARTYELSFVNQATGAFGPPFWVISTDGGYLDAPVKVDPAAGQAFTVMPGERYEVIVDFAGFPGNFVLRNSARTPYPKGAPPQGSTLGRVMQFRVGATTVADASYNPAAPAQALRTPMVRLSTAGGLGQAVAPTVARQLTLNEVMGMKMAWPNPITGVLTNYPGGPLEILVNNTKWSGTDSKTMAVRKDFTRFAGDPSGFSYSETPREGETEIWEIVNLTADAHPMHLHLVQFQILNRQGFAKNQYLTAYNALFPGGLFQGGFGPPLDYASFTPVDPAQVAGVPKYTHTFSGSIVPVVGGNPDVVPYLQGPVQPPLAQEQGWKDTVMVPPGMVTRLVVRWAPTTLPTTTPASSAYFPFDPFDGAQFNYVWHCHIIDHEDNEMMRPDVVLPNANAVRTYTKGASF
jgi:FtsP/CotA-like multicopper oxidase with cupredoxin domain